MANLMNTMNTQGGAPTPLLPPRDSERSTIASGTTETYRATPEVLAAQETYRRQPSIEASEAIRRAVDAQVKDKRNKERR
jgi:hypothetical protein